MENEFWNLILDIDIEMKLKCILIWNWTEIVLGFEILVLNWNFSPEER